MWAMIATWRMAVEGITKASEQLESGIDEAMQSRLLKNGGRLPIL